MNIKRYTIAAIIYMILVGWFVYAYISQETSSIDFFGIQLPPFPVALWVVVPVFVLYLASILHMGSCSLGNSFELRRFRKDYERLIEAIRAALLGKKSRDFNFKTKPYQAIGKIINSCDITPHESFSRCSVKEIQEVLDALQSVKEGKAVDLRAFHLANENALVVQNHLNRYKRGEVIAEDILNKPERFSKELAVQAYRDYVTTANVNQIVKYKIYMSREALSNILLRINAPENGIEMNNDTLIDLITQMDVNEEDYICGSIVLSHHMMPQQRMDLFERLSNDDDNAMAAHIFTLYDLEVIEEANNLLDAARDDEYLQFRAYKALKDAGKNYSIHLFTSKVCN